MDGPLYISHREMEGWELPVFLFNAVRSLIYATTIKDPLVHAASEGNLEIVRLLLNSGASVDVARQMVGLRYTSRHFVGVVTSLIRYSDLVRLSMHG